MASQLNTKNNIDAKDEDSDSTDDEIYDDYDTKRALIASNDKRHKQADTPSQSALDKLTVVNRAEDIHEIQRFIGRIKIAWKGLDSQTYACGTGTAVQQLPNRKYYVVLTCAHNLLRQKGQPAIELYFLPQGGIGYSDESKENESPKMQPRLECIAWEYNPKYNPEMRHCPNDIGLILCYDGQKYYKKLDLDESIDDIVQIAVNKNKKIKYCNIYGYPVGCEGTLRGAEGKAKIGKDNSGEWQYNIYTFPGHSGSAMYVWNSEKDIFQIYGVHTFGDLAEQKNMGVKLTEEHKQWISETVQNSFIPAMDRDKGQRAKERKQKKKDKTNELKSFLASLGLVQCYKNFAERGCDQIIDLADINSEYLRTDFLIAEYKHRKKIVRGLKAHLQIPKPQSGGIKYRTSMDGDAEDSESTDQNEEFEEFDQESNMPTFLSPSSPAVGFFDKIKHTANDDYKEQKRHSKAVKRAVAIPEPNDCTDSDGLDESYSDYTADNVPSYNKSMNFTDDNLPSYNKYQNKRAIVDTSME